MADLTFSAGNGAITSTLSTLDANATTIIDNFLKAYNDANVVDTWTNQEKADAFIALIKKYILNVHNAKKREDIEIKAVADVVDDYWDEPAANTPPTLP